MSVSTAPGEHRARRRRRVRAGLVTACIALALVCAALWQRAHPHVISTNIDIEAPPEDVWAVLTDFGSYPDWNPSLLGMSGELRVGERLRFSTAPGDDGLLIEPTVHEVDAPRGLRWEGSLLVVGLFDGDHHFRLEERPGGGTRLVQEETFRGVLIPFLAGWLDSTTMPEFEAMNAALAERAEGRAKRTSAALPETPGRAE